MRRHTLGMFLLLGLLGGTLVLLGCDEEEETTAEGEGDEDEPEVEDEPEPTVPEVVPTPVEAEPAGPTYTIHEWGLIDIDLTEQSVEYAAGPGRAEEQSATASNEGNNNNGRPNQIDIDEAVETANDLLGQFGGGRPFRPSAGRRKPVLYFHLNDEAPDFTFELTVDLADGQILEHFPRSEVDGGMVMWSDVGLRTESCTGGPYPTEESPVCEEVEDGYCESAELSDYVANDAGCLTVGGLEQNFLFYRGGGESPPMQVTIERGADGTVTLQNDAMVGPVGPVLRLRRDTDGTIKVAQVVMPAVGQSVSIPAPTDAAGDAHREVIRAQLRTIGLTPGEIGAFENAWFGELFDGESDTPHALPDAILFFLTPDAIEGYARLEAEPPPAEIVRAMAFRAGWPSL